MKEREHHGHATGGTSRTYNSWRMMCNRCHNPNATDYQHYGARGIVVCDRWRYSFQNFLDDMGERPSNLTIDRYPNNNGNYEPSNCRWATDSQQRRRRRNSRLVTFNGETKPLYDWCDQYGVNPCAVQQRLRMGWPPEAAFELEHNWQYRSKNFQVIEIGCFIGSLVEWCKALKLNKNTVQSRIYKQGQPAQKALELC